MTTTPGDWTVIVLIIVGFVIGFSLIYPIALARHAARRAEKRRAEQMRQARDAQLGRNYERAKWLNKGSQ